MRIIFQDENSKYEADVVSFEDIYYAIQSGLLAMGYHKDTAKEIVDAIKDEDGESD